jgi:PIN domain nuclease of toxin-antitoxin system
VILDSHSFLWWLEGDERLSATAEKIFEEGRRGKRQLILNPVTFWELRLKELKGTLQVRTPVSLWPRILEDLPWIEVIDVGADLWMALAELKWAHRDPADRLIAATALKYGVPVLSKDGKFHQEDSPVEAVW